MQMMGKSRLLSDQDALVGSSAEIGTNFPDTCVIASRFTIRELERRKMCIYVFVRLLRAKIVYMSRSKC